MSDQSEDQTAMQGSASPPCYPRLHQNAWETDRFGAYAEEYHRQCEDYDRTVCTDNWNGVAMPINGRQAGLVNRNARQVLSRIAERACDELGQPMDSVLPELRRAIRWFKG